MNRPIQRQVPLFIALGVALSAQVRFDTPKLGYVLDPEAKSIRLVSGIPGAAALETSIDGGGAIERAWISPQGYGLTQGKADAGIRHFDWTRGTSRGVAETADAVAMSANGRYFAVASGSVVEIWDGIATQALSRFDAPAGVRGLAVSDDGKAALAITATGVSLWQQSKLQQVWSGEAVRGADFFAGSHDFAAFDGATNKILTMRGGAVIESDARSQGATAFALSADGKALVLGGERTIEIVDVATGTSTLLAVESPVESLARTGSAGDVLQVAFRGDSRTALLEWGGTLAKPQIEVLLGGGAQ